ncbi:SsrA-binding protein SmpB ['Elaeagnus angustifolia' witches'-broom phytoplasma]|uniref:SsrA-binding protein n=1 Tax='Elaeagnus angustifolia' witches'-broom phytoplasma TaxID=1538355 RepID=A0ABS5V8F3_9MOLU|nr:SsrA-binding protein SmpB ['Elaeagnus angustifolia' witches'-broom phytoplasma]MBY7576886.1 SsrA-binding protein SmpB [Candidatus Phytoplasma australiense]MCX2955541.1 SsrA-binding protein SmpB [Candidatus Phytoplasma australiense]
MKTIITNKKAFYDYFLEKKKYQAGIKLLGSEVKSIRIGKINLLNSYIHIKNEEVFIVNMTILKYPFSCCLAYDENRTKKLLLQKHEIIQIQNKIKTEKLSVIPLKVYFNKNLVKLEIALAKGKKQHDKRNALKDFDAKLRIQKTLKNFNQKQ